jgi:hypothetical protein
MPERDARDDAEGDPKSQETFKQGHVIEDLVALLGRIACVVNGDVHVHVLHGCVLLCQYWFA